MNKLQAIRAAMNEYDRGIAAIRVLTGDPDLDAVLHTPTDWQAMVRQLLPIVEAAQVLIDGDISTFAPYGMGRLAVDAAKLNALRDALKGLDE